MHLLILVRGIKHEVDRFISDLQAQYWPLKHREVKDALVQLGVRPIQLYELIFPKEALPDVLATIQPQGFNNKWQHFILGFFRRLLPKGCYNTVWKPIPRNLQKSGHARIVYRSNLECVGIGIKEDGDMKDDKGNSIHERL